MSVYEEGPRKQPKFTVTVTPVPPPKKAPHYAETEAAGIHPGFRLSDVRGQSRCGECGRMIEDTKGVWIPDGMRKHDSYAAFTEAARRNAYNGTSTLWCLRCAPKAERKPLQPEPITRTMSPQDPRMNLVAAGLFAGIIICLIVAKVLG